MTEHLSNGAKIVVREAVDAVLTVWTGRDRQTPIRAGESRDLNRGNNGLSLRSAARAENIIAGDNLKIIRKDGIMLDAIYKNYSFVEGRIVFHLSIIKDEKEIDVHMRSRDIGCWEKIEEVKETEEA